METLAVSDELFDHWCLHQEVVKTNKVLRILRERPGAQSVACRKLWEIVPRHYIDPQRIEGILRRWDYKKALAIVKGNIPAKKTARSGDLAEILATEYVNRKLDFKVPIFRLRWRDDREMALRGDDVIGIRLDTGEEIHFLKGEVKSRQTLTPSVIVGAATSLARHKGRPAPYTINFIAARLSELGEDELCARLEGYLAGRTIPIRKVTHLIFTLSGNDSHRHLEEQLESYSGGIKQMAIGLVVDNHTEFIGNVFNGVNLAVES